MLLQMAIAPFGIMKPAQRRICLLFRQQRLFPGFTTILAILLLLSASPSSFVEGFAGGRVVGTSSHNCCCTNHLLQQQQLQLRPTIIDSYNTRGQQQHQTQTPIGNELHVVAASMPLGFVLTGAAVSSSATGNVRDSSSSSSSSSSPPSDNRNRNKRYGAELRKAKRDKSRQVRRQRAEREDGSLLSLQQQPGRATAGPLVVLIRSLQRRFRSKLSSIWVAFRYWLFRS